MVGRSADPAPSLSAVFQEGDRVAVLAAVKQVRHEAWVQTHARFLEQINEISGLDVCIRLTRTTDALVAGLFRQALRRVAAPVEAERSIALFATGGYGRGELNPHSDIDLLLLSPAAGAPSWESECYQAFTALLWDAGFKVGALRCRINELERIIAKDFITATAVIEQRPLLGSTDLQGGLRELLERFRKRRAKAFLQFKVEELQQRQSQVGASLFRMEPDLKTNPGCLRDIQLLMNISFMLCGERLLRALTTIDGMESGDIQPLYRAKDFILKLRSLNHFHHDRAADRWVLRDQLRMANQLGYAGVSHLRAVELLMRDYYLLVRHVVQMVDLTVGHLAHHGHLGRRQILVKSRRPVVSGFTAIAGKVYCSDRSFWHDPRLCVRLMSMCRQAQRSGYRFSFVLKRSLRQWSHRIDDQQRTDAEAAAQFMAILADTGSLGHILADMHDGELLGAYLPEFGNLTCLMQFDAYHEYTTDQHTLFAMANLAKLWKGILPGLAGMTTVLRGTMRRDLLALALLMHDVGKYMGRGHRQRGAEMVMAVAARLGLDESDTECLYGLVLHHTMLSGASRSRDISDPDLLADLADKIVSRERLDMLYCLTYCDILAVGEGILTGWQAELLESLYDLLCRTLAQSPGSSRPAPHKRFLGALAAHGVSTEEAERFLASLPPGYVFQADGENAWRHLQLLRRSGDHCPDLCWQASGGAALIDVLLPPGVGVFAALCAVLTGRGCNIEDAHIWTEASGLTLCRLRLEATPAASVAQDGYWRTTRHHLERAVADPAHAWSLLDHRRSNKRYHEAAAADSAFNDPSVRIDQRTSASTTILDVQERDEVGLLSDLCRLIAQQGCAIRYASIATLGDVAQDVFYVVREGRKLSDADAGALQRAIEDAYDMRGRAARNAVAQTT